MKKIKIIVCYHKDSCRIQDDVYLPVHVGKATSNCDLAIQGDNDGENISYLNNLYCELTGLFWAWKNLDADYIGLCHYRRFFTFKRNRLKVLFKRILNLGMAIFLLFGRRVDRMFYDQIEISSESELIKQVELFKIKVSKILNTKEGPKIFAPAPVNFLFESVRNNISSVAGQHHLDILKNILNDKFPEYLPYYEKTIKSNRLYYANMALMEKSIFNEYCNFIFTLLDDHRETIITTGLYNSLSEGSLKRLSGYLGELLTSVFLLAKKDILSHSDFKEIGMIYYSK